MSSRRKSKTLSNRKWSLALIAAMGLLVLPLAGPAGDPTVSAYSIWQETDSQFGQVVTWQGGHGRYVVCFAEGTDPAYVEEVTTQANTAMSWFGEAADRNQDYYTGNSWNSVGSPIALTWSLVPEGFTNWAGESGSGSNTMFSRMDALFAGNRALWLSRFTQAFDRWSALSGITFTQETFGANDWDDGASWWTASGNSNRGDIRIGMRNLDGANGTLAFAYFPGGGNGGNMILDRAENWASGSTDLFLRNVLAHESGHSIGLEHVCPTNSSKLMEPLIIGADGPRHDDVRAVMRQHGDPYENNDTAGTATYVGVLATGSPISIGDVPSPNINNTSIASMESNDDWDYYRFTINEAMDISVTLTPLGFSYDSSTQAGNGSCNSGNIIDSKSMVNLNIRLVDTDGSTTLINANTQPAGSNETFEYSLTTPGDYYLRVTESEASIPQTQLYKIDMSAIEFAVPSVELEVLDQVLLPKTDLNWEITVTNPAPIAQSVEVDLNAILFNNAFGRDMQNQVVNVGALSNSVVQGSITLPNRNNPLLNLFEGVPLRLRARALLAGDEVDRDDGAFMMQIHDLATNQYDMLIDDREVDPDGNGVDDFGGFEGWFVIHYPNITGDAVHQKFLISEGVDDGNGAEIVGLEFAMTSDVGQDTVQVQVTRAHPTTGEPDPSQMLFSQSAQSVEWPGGSGCGDCLVSLDLTSGGHGPEVNEFDVIWVSVFYENTGTSYAGFDNPFAESGNGTVWFESSYFESGTNPGVIELADGNFVCNLIIDRDNALP